MPDKIDTLILNSPVSSDALGELYALLSKDVFYYAFSILKNQEAAQDIMQDVFIALKGTTKFTPEGKGKAYILALTRNLAYKALSKSSKLSSLDYDIAGDDFTYASDNKILAAQLLLSLSSHECELLNLRLFCDLPFKQISAILNKPAGTLRWKYSQIIKKLKKTPQAKSFLEQ